MICACAQSIASLPGMLAPLPANVAAMGNVNAAASAQAALAAAASANAALAAGLAANATLGATVPFNATAMANVTALANGLGALMRALRLPLASGNCAPTLEQLMKSLADHGFGKMLGGLPMSTLSPLQALAQLANAIGAANAMGVGLLSPTASAQLQAAAQANAAAAANAAASVNAQAALNAQAFLAMQLALSANLGVNIGAPGGVAAFGARMNALSSNMSALNALNGLLNAALLSQTLALLTALDAIRRNLGINMLTPGAGRQVQPRLKQLSLSAPSLSLPGGKSLSRSVSPSRTVSPRTRSLNKSAQRAFQDGLGNMFGGLPVLPPATLLLAYLLDKLFGQLGVGLVQYSPCGPLCLIPMLPCPVSTGKMLSAIAAQGAALQAPKLAFEASTSGAASTSTGADATAAAQPSAAAGGDASAGAAAGADAAAASGLGHAGARARVGARDSTTGGGETSADSSSESAAPGTPGSTGAPGTPKPPPTWRTGPPKRPTWPKRDGGAP